MTVWELIAKVADEGFPVRLNWSRSSAATEVVDYGIDYPTGILPVITL